MVFGHSISPHIQRKIQSLAEYTEAHPFEGFEECVASYTGLTVYYNPWKVFEASPDKRPGDTMKERMAAYIRSAEMTEPASPRQVEIPVCYGGVYGPDLAYVAEYHHMTEEEVVKSIRRRSTWYICWASAPDFPTWAAWIQGLPLQGGRRRGLPSLPAASA